MIPSVIEAVNRMIAHSKAKAAKEENTDPRALGNITQSLDTGATAVAQLAKATEKFTPPTPRRGFRRVQFVHHLQRWRSSRHPRQGTLDHGVAGEDLEGDELVEHMSKTASGPVASSLDMSKSSRLLEVSYDGTAWSAKWAGSYVHEMIETESESAPAPDPFEWCRSAGGGQPTYHRGRPSAVGNDRHVEAVPHRVGRSQRGRDRRRGR